MMMKKIWKYFEKTYHSSLFRTKIAIKKL